MMNGKTTFRTLATVLLAWSLLSHIAAAQASSRLSSRFLVRGEKALLEIAITDSQPTEFPRIEPIEGIEIQQAGRGPRTQLQPGRRLEYVFEYLVSSYNIGSHTLPSFEIVAGGTKYPTEPLTFTVFNPDELQWADASSGRIPFRYASAFRVLNPNPYEGETTPVEIKLFVPRDLFVEEGGWGIPDFQRDGITSWRYQPSAMRGQVNLLGMPYVSVAYPSTLTTTRTGKVGIGPATIRLMTTEVVMDGVLQRVPKEVNISVPKLEIDCQPLPPGAPDGFENAVGDFKLSVSTKLTEVQEGDPIPVDITVTGSGNLDTLRPPAPMDTSGWKLYEATADQRGDERREFAGTTTFHQFIRPLEMKSAVPSFRLVYFDPKEKAYKTLTSDPIVLTMKPSAPAAATAALAPPPSLATPVERMTDILGVLTPSTLTIEDRNPLPRWIAHAIGAVLALLLIAKALWLKHGHRFYKDPVRQKRLAALREVETLRGDDHGFLMSAGRFIESWLGKHPDPELRGILAERDTYCFRGDTGGLQPLSPARRSAILQVLRKASMAVIFVFLTAGGISSARAQDSPNLAEDAKNAYDSAKFDEAVGMWLKAGPYESLSADTLYNIGNACYRAGSPGHAALYYRRALTRDPGHAESRQNLRFIERKYGSITVHRPEYQYALARLPLASWQNMLWAGAWTCLLAILIFPATRPGARARLFAVFLLVIGPLLATSGALGWRYFPNDSEFAALSKQAVIVEQEAILHADAARTSPEVIDAPPGSICEIIRTSGRWAYVAFATKTRGWIPMENIETVIPKSALTVPKIRKPKADGKSA